MARGLRLWWPAMVRWTARIWGLAVAALAFAFLVEHLTWFRGPGYPPVSVEIAVLFHLVTIVGLVAAWRWGVTGACMALGGTAGFALAAGGGWRLFPIVGVVAVPAILWLLLGLADGHQGDARAAV